MSKVLRIEDAEIYQGENLVLSKVNLTLQHADFKYIIGKTGSGKSSLLKTLYADIPLKSGEAEAAGYNLRTIKKSEVPFLRRKIGIVFQDFQLLPDRNVEENLLFVLRATGWTDKNQMNTRVEEVLSRVGLINKGYKMPHQISAGEQQRVVIARSLLNDPELLLADEPTGNLDPDTSDEILQLMKEINSQTGTAILFATHDYRLIQKYPFTVVRCFQGEVVEHQILTR